MCHPLGRPRSDGQPEEGLALPTVPGLYRLVGPPFSSRYCHAGRPLDCATPQGFLDALHTR